MGYLIVATILSAIWVFHSLYMIFVRFRNGNITSGWAWAIRLFFYIVIYIFFYIGGQLFAGPQDYKSPGTVLAMGIVMWLIKIVFLVRGRGQRAHQRERTKRPKHEIDQGEQQERPFYEQEPRSYAAGYAPVTFPAEPFIVDQPQRILLQKGTIIEGSNGERRRRKSDGYSLCKSGDRIIPPEFQKKIK